LIVDPLIGGDKHKKEWNMPRTGGNRGGSRGRGNSRDTVIDSLRERPIAAAAAAAGVAAAGAFLWARRTQISDAFSSGMDSLSEMKAQRMQGKDQSDFAEEALTLKETGRKSKGSRGPISQQDIKAGMAVG
jgi:hypothetical protein